MQPWLRDLLSCPDCGGSLRADGEWLVCTGACERAYPIVEDIPVFLDAVPMRTAPGTPSADEPPQIDAVADLVASNAGAVNLDVGCGTGRNLDLFEGRYVGCDPDFTALRAAKARADGDRAAAFVCCDGRQLPFLSEAFAFVLSSEVIEHVPPDDRGRFAEELRRVLAPDGSVLISAPIDTALGNGLAALARRVGLVGGNTADETHPRTTVEELRDLGCDVCGCLDSPAKEALHARGLGPVAGLYDRGVRHFPRLSTHCVGVSHSRSS